MYYYIKAIHIIFVVTWFAGLFYFPRLLIYNTEIAEKPERERNAIREQFNIMMKRLWYGITWPSAILTLIFGTTALIDGNWLKLLFDSGGRWLLIKLIFVVFLYLYHLSLHKLFKEQTNGVFKYSSQQLRVWNEVATIFLVAIVILATVKQSLSFIWGIVGLAGFIILLMGAIKIYKRVRTKPK